MEPSTIFTILVGVVEILLMFILRDMKEDLKTLQGDMRNIPIQYVLKQDYKIDLEKIENKLDRILEKVEKKADK